MFLFVWNCLYRSTVNKFIRKQKQIKIKAKAINTRPSEVKDKRTKRTYSVFFFTAPQKLIYKANMHFEYFVLFSNGNNKTGGLILRPIRFFTNLRIFEFLLHQNVIHVTAHVRYLDAPLTSKLCIQKI